MRPRRTSGDLVQAPDTIEHAVARGRREIGPMFDRVSRRLLDEHAGDEQGRMLRSVGLKTADRFYAFATQDAIVVKLPESRVAELISTEVGRPCDPRGGRPMRQWVRLQPADDAACTAYLIEARSFVASQANRNQPIRPHKTAR